MIHFSKLSNNKYSAGFFVLAAAMLLLPIGTAWAASQAFSVLQGSPQNGMLMSFTANPEVATPATRAAAASLIGIVSPTSSDIQQRPGQISIQTDGVAEALVSTLNGNILVGDRITASALEGVGVKATGNAWIVGVAQASFDAASSGAVQTTVTDTDGKRHDVSVGRIPVAIKVTYYSALTNNDAWIPPALQHVADSLAGKHVSTRAIIFGFLLFLIGLATAGLIIYSAVKGGFTAIGRQPLVKFVILRQEWKSFGAAALILLFSFAAALLLLRLF